MSDRPHLRVHATSVVLSAAARPFGGREDVAILLFGASGSGKSDIALRLIAAGARLISDDQTSLFVADGILCAEAAPHIGGLFEIRGAGIISIPGMDGTIGTDGAPVALVVRLEPEAGPDTGPKPQTTIARLPEPATYKPPPPLAPATCPPIIVLHPFEASTPAKIAAIASAATTGRFVAGVVPSNNP